MLSEHKNKKNKKKKKKKRNIPVTDKPPSHSRKLGYVVFRIGRERDDLVWGFPRPLVVVY